MQVIQPQQLGQLKVQPLQGLPTQPLKVQTQGLPTKPLSVQPVQQPTLNPKVTTANGLPISKRQQLDDIVLKLAQQNAPRETVQAIVDDFKAKYPQEFETQPEAQSLGGFAKNVATSGVQFGKDIGSAVLNVFNPNADDNTLVNLGKLGIGAAEKLIPGQQGLESRADAVGQFFANRYGSVEKLKTTVYQDPVGFLADLSTILTGGAGAIKSASKLAGVAGKVKTASTLGKVAEVARVAADLTDPLVGTTKALKAVLPANFLEGKALSTYKSALKPSNASFSGFEQTNLMKAGLDNNVLVTAGGLEKTRDLLTKTNNEISTLIKTAAEQGKTVSLDAMLKPLDNLREYYKTSDTPSVYMKQIDDYEQAVRADHGTLIPIDQAQKIKQQIYKQLGDSAWGELQTLVKENKKSLARGAKEEMVKQYPELDTLNKTDTSLINLQDALDSAVKRIGNREIVGLRDMGALLINPKLLLVTLFDNPTVKSALAVALNKLSKRKAKTGLGRKALTPTTRATQASSPKD